MLSSLFRWRKSPMTPQDEFKKLHAMLAAPPALCCRAPPGAESLEEATTRACIVDPYHFIVCQHGVLSTSADFDNVITDLFVHHEVSVLEAAELAKAAGGDRAAASAASPSWLLQRGATGAAVDARALPCEYIEAAILDENTFERDSGLPVSVPSTSTPTVTCSVASSTLPAAACGAQSPSATAAFTAQPPPQPPLSGNTGVESGKMPKTNADPLRPDTALTQAQRTRRDNYKATFRLSVEYPNSTSGRLYRSGNLRVFSPGSNNYLRSDAGTLACARKMLAETVPQLHAWLDDVDMRERQRRAQWAVYARTLGTPEAARLSDVAAAPMPVCLSFMAHSFGGIIERECLYLLFMDTVEVRAQDVALHISIVSLRQRLRAMNVRFENFLNIATPHCGAGECLWWPIYFGAWCLARLHLCQTYDELILSDADRVLQTRLLDEPHLKVLGLFRRRVLFANTHRDLLVGFGTCSLIFEKMDVDHTKFLGVAASEMHCAAAFADDTIEISKPIVLRSFAEEDEAESSKGFLVGRQCSLTTQRSGVPATGGRTYTLFDLDEEAVAHAPAAGAGSPNIETQAVMKDGGCAAREGAGSSDVCCFPSCEPKGGDVFSNTLSPQTTFSSLSGLSSSPLSVISASSAATAGPVSAFTPFLTIGCNVPSHAIEEMTLEDAVGPDNWANDDDNNEEKEDNSDDNVRGNDLLTVVMDVASSSSGDFELGYGSPSSASVSPVSQMARPLTVVRGSPRCDGYTRFVRSSPINPASPNACLLSSPRWRSARWDSDFDSASSSRRSCGSRVVSVLKDPRWASEHVRHAAAFAHAEARTHLHRAASLVLRSKGGSKAEAPLSDAPVSGGAITVPTLLNAATTTHLAQSTSPSLIPSDEIPQYRQTPRAIAARLREKLSWRVRAVRFDNLIPVGHVACLGNWAFCGRSPLLVQSVAEELLMILD
ncbi:hypothetical protein ABL78_3009 [Leptomonas seymouri]|uniref:DUF676 domain-containing protein n=1 Tax=Leptomonas seymouri TaxID=5684 RepID=A0A0N0P6Q8_LEPSE|nr:hypothetical protein ABL78_3009 [Leptomonas seymouri]|eukprot:KPI87899.1 hypothetical protein ABL78_3009 [Leptomonas seymouri]